MCYFRESFLSGMFKCYHLFHHPVLSYKKGIPPWLEPPFGYIMPLFQNTISDPSIEAKMSKLFEKHLHEKSSNINSENPESDERPIKIEEEEAVENKDRPDLTIGQTDSIGHSKFRKGALFDFWGAAEIFLSSWNWTATVQDCLTKLLKQSQLSGEQNENFLLIRWGISN